MRGAVAKVGVVCGRGGGGRGQRGCINEVRVC